jgi:hypothetical protein
MALHFFGIRHHGPGGARSLAQALQQLQPDAILIEGPPEADELLPLAAHAEMRPPVALLVYAPAMPQHASHFPFAEFSPEWQAIQYGQAHGVPTRFIDLPMAHTLAAHMSVAAEEGDEEAGEEAPQPVQRSGDAMAQLAQAAGFSDFETWWDHLVEQRHDSLELFAAIEEMMSVARQSLQEPLSQREAQREAHMRQMIRAAQKQGYERIAVVCGAWHVPALRDMPTAKHDKDVLSDLPKAKVAATWTPWSYGRLSFDSGYGAGVQAPGWYHHLWHTPQRASTYWLTDAVRLLRKNGLDASSAHVIEALRLADSLAALRDRPRAGLNELLEALQSVLFGDSDAPDRARIAGQRPPWRGAGRDADPAAAGGRAPASKELSHGAARRPARPGTGPAPAQAHGKERVPAPLVPAGHRLGPYQGGERQERQLPRKMGAGVGAGL